jgi:Mg/Co/Ni transporter MgtE
MMTDEDADKIIQLLLADQSAGLKAFAALTVEQRKQVLEKAQDERINQIVAEADAESITD